MAQINRKYIDSHWLVFIFQGIIALIFGALTLFTAQETSRSMTKMIGYSMLALAIVEFANCFYRGIKSQGWFVTLFEAIFDAGFGVALIFMNQADDMMRVILLALYTTLRGIFEIFVGFRTTIDPTDRFIWAFAGVIGCIMGFAILNADRTGDVMAFVRFFGAYFLIFGTASMIYSIHNREQQREDRAARVVAAKKSSKKRK